MSSTPMDDFRDRYAVPQEADKEYVTQNGVVFQLQPPSSSLYFQVVQQFKKDVPEPQPPDVWMEDKQRSESNPNDPKYIADVAAWTAESVLRLSDAMISFGVKSYDVPDDVIEPDSEEFVELLEAALITPETSKRRRLLQWIDYVAIPNVRDKADFMIQLRRLSGVQEVDTAEALDSMFRDAKQPTDNEPSTDRED